MSIEHRILGKTGLSVSAVGFGGSETGYGAMGIHAVAKLLNSALDAGLNLIDTAECYGDGEEQIGRAIADRRDDFFLMTKCGHSDGADGPDWDPAMLARSIDRSLKRLRMDYVDVMQLHSCSAATLADGGAIDALVRARDAGKTRFIGYSGDGPDALWAIESRAFDTLQISLSIADQEAIDLLLPKAREHAVGVIAKRPIANAAWIGRRPASDWYSRPYYDRLKQLDYDFLSAANSVEVALRFTLSTPGVHTAIVGTTKPGRWEQNAKAASAGPLPTALYEKIRARWRSVARPGWSGQR